jgi:hypothetical protein
VTHVLNLSTERLDGVAIDGRLGRSEVGRYAGVVMTRVRMSITIAAIMTAVAAAVAASSLQAAAPDWNAVARADARWMGACRDRARAMARDVDEALDAAVR